MTYETHARCLKEDDAYALERQPKVQRGEVLTRIKLVPEVGSLVSFRPNDCVGYNPVLRDGEFRGNTHVKGIWNKIVPTSRSWVKW